MARTATQVAEAAATGKDGAKPGSGKRSPADKQGFNAAARAKAREAEALTLWDDGPEFFRRRKNWAATRELRALLRNQEATQLGITRVNKQIAELDIDEDTGPLETRVDALQDEGDLAAYEIIALLLRDPDGNPPSIELLQEHLDVEDVGALAAQLAGGGEQPADPTATPSS